jgi:hypothetical protein
MRSIQTFILHLYVDPEAPERLCGDLNALPEGKAHSFRNQAELIGLLLLGARGQPTSRLHQEETQINIVLSDKVNPSEGS